MELVVLNVAYPFAPVGPDVPGDAEKALAHLDAALAQAGHESFVMACEGSMTQGILLATPRPSAQIYDTERRHSHEQYRYILRTFLKKWPIDLIHMHGGDFYEYLPPPGVPVLVTLHLPIDQYPEMIFHLDRPQTFLHCTSASQRRACPPCAYLLPEIEDIAAPELIATALGKYFAIYERLVAEARALETAAVAPGQRLFEPAAISA
ncbi:MAG TPA: hypothetical protein VGI88_10880 [Verrucomicrobiae bacterium]|jgi:hypothetical protein